MFDTNNSVPRSEGKPLSALKRLARKLKVEIKFAGKSGEIHSAFAPESPYNTTKEGRRLKAAAAYKKPAEPIYTGGKRTRIAEGLEENAGKPRGVPAYGYKVLRPGKSYAHPGQQWVSVKTKEDILPGETSAAQPLYEKRRLDPKRFLKAKFDSATKPIRASMLQKAAPEADVRSAERAAKRDIFKNFVKQAEEEAQATYGKRQLSKKDVHNRLKTLLTGEMKHHRDYQAGELRESRAIIRARGANYQSARANPERMVGYKKHLDELVSRHQQVATGARERAVNKIRGIAARGIQAISGSADEESLGKARRSVGILTDPYHRGGAAPESLQKESVETLANIFQRGSRTTKQVTPDRLRKLKGNLDEASIRASDYGRDIHRVKAVKSGELFRNAPKLAKHIEGYPYLGKLGVGIGAAGLLAAGGMALYTHRKNRQQFSVHDRLIRFAELPPEAMRLLDKLAQRNWQEGQRAVGSIVRSPRLRRRIGLAKLKRKWQTQARESAVQKMLAKPDLPTHPNAPSWKGLYEQKVGEIGMLKQTHRTKDQIAEDTLKAAEEGHKKALGDIEQKGFVHGHSVGRQAELVRGKGIREEQANALRGQLGEEGNKRARRLKWIAAGTAAGGIGAGYAIGRHDKESNRRHDAMRALNMYKHPSHQFSALDKIRDQLSGQSKDNTTHDVAIGAIEGGLAYPASEYAFKKFAPKGSGIGRKIAIGGAVGGAATGLVGLTLSGLRKRRQQHDMSSKLKSIQFQTNQRTLVARDRYSKQIHEADIDKANTRYVRSGLLGAGIGALSKGKMPIGRKALLGAAAGVGAQKLARIYGSSTRDQFGDRSWGGKRVERAPEVIGTAGLGIAAVRHISHSLQHLPKLPKRFSSKTRLIQFQNDNDEGPEWLQKWAHKKLYGRSYNTAGQVQKLKKYAGRTQRIVRDVDLKRQGLPNLDARGRPRKNEWEKPWVAGAVTTAGLIGAYKGLKHGIKFINAAPVTSKIGQLREGFTRADYANKVPGLQKVGQFFKGVKEDLTRWRDKPIHAAPKWESSKVNPKTGKMKTPSQVSTEETDRHAKNMLEKIGKGKLHKTEFRSILKDIRFAQTLSDWDITPRSRGSVVVHAPGSQRRDRRTKEWHERKANQRHITEGILGSLALVGGGGALYARKRGIRIGKSIARTTGSTGHPLKPGEELIGSGPFKFVRSKLRPQAAVEFEEPKRKHNVGAGLLVAAAGLPLYKGAAKFARIGARSHIDRFMGNPLSHGKMVADYLEGSQHILNQGITGKLAGMALRNPKAPIVKGILGRGPIEIGDSKSGINKLSREHYSAFRASHSEALDAWAGETVAHYEHAKNDLKTGKELRNHYSVLQEHLKGLQEKGYNEREAFRHAVNDPRHDKLFRRMVAFKAGPTKYYQKVTAGLSAIPAGAGAAVAATTRKNKNSSHTFSEPDDRKRHSFPKLGALYSAGAITGAGIATGSKATQSLMKGTGGNIRKIMEHLDRYLSKKL